MNNLRERIAELMHDQWSGWIEYMFSKCEEDQDGGMRIPPWAVDRWKRQMATLYENLSEAEQESDRIEADKVLQIISILRKA